MISLLESCNLSSEDIKVQYNNIFLPVSMVLQFPLHSAYENAVRVMNRKGRYYYYKMERQNFSYPMKFAMVQFPSKVDAMNAVLEKNGSFCLNTQISMRVLQ
ncbi:hypothetical protein MKW92_045252 [Papaver armeniacum]|nr:hypothetical protein MKW92_045252 [Papaver armeniacum]